MRTALVLGTELIGRPVVDLTSGDEVALVRDVVFNGPTGELIGFTLNEPRAKGLAALFSGGLRSTLEIERVDCLGPDAIMVRGPGAVDPGAGAGPAGDVNPDRDEVTGDVAITESGRQLGTVRDVVIATGRTPRVVGYRIGGGSVGDVFVPLVATRAVSGSALVLPDGFETTAQFTVEGLAAELAAADDRR